MPTTMDELNLWMVIPGIPRLVVAISEWLGIASALTLLPRRWSKGVTALLLLPMLAGQITLRCFLTDYSPMSKFLLLMLLNVVYMLPCIALLVKGNLHALLTCWGISFIQAEANASLSWMLVSLLFAQPSMGQPLPCLTTLVTMALVQAFTARVFRKAGMDQLQDASMAVRMWAIALMTFWASNYFILFTDYQQLMQLQGMSLSACRYAVDLCGLFLAYNSLMTHKHIRMEREMTVIKGIMNAQYQQYRDYKETTGYISRQCHDLKHQLAVLRDTRKQADMQQELDRMKLTIERYETYTNTGSPVLDTILTQKLIHCREHDIQMSYTADAAALSAIRPVDICTLFGNLLDNAIEHTQQLPALEDRQIILSVQRHGQLLTAEVENRCDRELVYKDGQLRTSKEDETMHGFGCKSVVYTAKSYGGTAHFRTEDGWFIASVLLPVPAQEQAQRAS